MFFKIFLSYKKGTSLTEVPLTQSFTLSLYHR
nr:MAG TPA: hypothetical protein [Caudoviricetes sp.]